LSKHRNQNGLVITGESIRPVRSNPREYKRCRDIFFLSQTDSARKIYLRFLSSFVFLFLLFGFLTLHEIFRFLFDDTREAASNARSREIKKEQEQLGPPSDRSLTDQITGQLSAGSKTSKLQQHRK